MEGSLLGLTGGSGEPHVGAPREPRIHFGDLKMPLETKVHLPPVSDPRTRWSTLLSPGGSRGSQDNVTGVVSLTLSNMQVWEVTASGPRGDSYHIRAKTFTAHPQTKAASEGRACSAKESVLFLTFLKKIFFLETVYRK